MESKRRGKWWSPGADLSSKGIIQTPYYPSSSPLPCPLSQHTDVHRDNAIEAFNQVARVTLKDPMTHK